MQKTFYSWYGHYNIWQNRSPCSSMAQYKECRYLCQVQFPFVKVWPQLYQLCLIRGNWEQETGKKHTTECPGFSSCWHITNAVLVVTVERLGGGGEGRKLLKLYTSALNQCKFNYTRFINMCCKAYLFLTVCSDFERTAFANGRCREMSVCQNWKINHKKPRR